MHAHIIVYLQRLKHNKVNIKLQKLFCGLILSN